MVTSSLPADGYSSAAAEQMKNRTLQQLTVECVAGERMVLVQQPLPQLRVFNKECSARTIFTAMGITIRQVVQEACMQGSILTA